MRVFFKYFLQKFDRNPIKIFSLALYRARDFSHPQSDGSDIPNDFLLREVFIGNPKNYGIESFKALYYYDKDTRDGKGDRKMSVNVFKNHLEYAGIQVHVQSECKEKFFLLPIQPGMLFVLCLIKLLHELEVNSFNLEFINNCTKIAISLTHPEIFKAAVLTGGGTSVEAFRSLLACKKDVFVNHVGSSQGENIAAKWSKPEPLSPRIFAPLLEYKVEGSKLLLSWTFSQPPSPPFSIS